MELANSKKQLGLILALSLVLFLHFHTSHPTSGSGGYTGAPGDSTCLQCHSTGSVNGNVQLSGIPASVDPGLTYPITVTINNTVGSALRAGFQLVTLKTSTNTNSGTMGFPATETNAIVKTLSGPNGKQYVGHLEAKNFSGNVVTYDVEWTAPTDQDGEEIRFYVASIIGDGMNANSGDRWVTDNFTSMITGVGADPLGLSFSNVAGVFCNGDATGTATADVTGGTPNYTYDWDNGETDATATMLTPGMHQVIVTDANNATIMDMVNIPDATALTAGVVFEEVVSCFGGNDGQAEIQGVGGTGIYLYDWSHGATGPIQNNLAAGPYTITVSDQNDCLITVDIDIDQPDDIVIQIINIDEPQCSDTEDGAISVLASGGTSPYTYNWDTPLGIPNDGDITNLPAGEYIVDVVDDHNCLSSLSITLDGPDELTASIINVSHETCAGNEDGAAEVLALGGSPDYTYLWSNGSTLPNQLDLASGTHSVMVTDDHGCISESTVEILAGTDINVQVLVNSQPSCGLSNGVIEAFVTDGTGTIQYEWSNGETTQVIGNLSAGFFTVTVTDDNGCTAEGSQILTDGNDMTVTVESIMNIDCHGDMDGGAAIVVTGGLEPISFMWADGSTMALRNDLAGGSYMVSVTDGNLCMDIVAFFISEPDMISIGTIQNIGAGCDTMNPKGLIQISAAGGTIPYQYLWSTGETTDQIQNKPAGNYSMTMTDANNCMTIYTADITEGNDLEVVPEYVTPRCHGESTGAIFLVIVNGIEPYQVEWQDGSADTINRNDLSAGEYTYTVTDASLCTVTNTVTLVDPDVLSTNGAATSETAEDANDGTATVNPLGGTQPYQVVWSTGANTLSITDLMPGQYQVTVTDNRLCMTVENLTVNSFGCDLEVSTSVSDVSCNGEADGYIFAVALGGTEPYSYLWSDSSTKDTLKDISAGTYQLTVMDNGGCIVSSEITVTEPDTLSLTGMIVHPTEGLSNGSIVTTTTGGTQPYTYNWSNNETTANIDSLDSGTYTVVTTDAHGCTLSDTFTLVTIPCSDSLIILSVADTLCFGVPDGVLSAMLVSQDTTASYLWSTGSQAATIDSLAPGTYSLTVTSDIGCIYIANITLIENTEIITTEVTVVDESTSDASDGSISATTTGGTPPYVYEWFDESNSVVSMDEMLTNISAGEFYLCVTDAVGCNKLTGPIVVSVGTSVENPHFDNINIYPVPSSDIIYLDMDAADIRNLNIYDITGKALTSEYRLHSSNTIRVNIEHLEIGYYLIRVETEEGIVTKKIVVAR